MSMVNIYDFLPKKYGSGSKPKYKGYEKVHIELPNRLALVGPSGSGKSVALVNFILDCACFTRIFLCVKSPEEPLYQWLCDELRAIELRVGKEILTVITDVAEMPTVDEFDPSLMNLCVFDDVITDGAVKLKAIADLWVRGRKKNITTVILSQAFYKIPKLCRDNTDVCILKSIGGKRDLKLILSEFAVDKTVEELMEMYRRCNTSSVTDFFLVDKTPGIDAKYRFRHGWKPLGDEE